MLIDGHIDSPDTKALTPRRVAAAVPTKFGSSFELPRPVDISHLS